MIIAHISDVHFGRIAHPEIVDALVKDVAHAGADLVVASGDLTQRARRREFLAAAEMLSRFQAPTLCVPGNHDVYAWWYAAGRLTQPLKRYRRYITDDLNPTFQNDDVAILGINSAIGWTIKGGRVREADRENMTSFFEDVPEDRLRILVVHHHLTRIHALGRHDVARNARRTLDAAQSAGVDLILCGHLHVSHIEPFEIIPGEHRTIIVSAGTATSDRGRGAHKETNFYNIIDIGPRELSIDERRFDPKSVSFVSESRTAFDRQGVVSWG